MCGAESPGKNSSSKLSAITKAIVKSRRQLNAEKTIREQLIEDMQQQIANGSGLYFTRIATGSSEIIYGHDKPLLADSKVVMKLSTAGISMTGDYTGDDSTTTWYGATFDGTWLANIISTMQLFFDYAHGGTLTLGGQGNGNGVLEVYDANNNLIGQWDNTGADITGTIANKVRVAIWRNTSVDHYGDAIFEITGCSAQTYREGMLCGLIGQAPTLNAGNYNNFFVDDKGELYILGAYKLNLGLYYNINDERDINLSSLIIMEHRANYPYNTRTWVKTKTYFSSGIELSTGAGIYPNASNSGASFEFRSSNNEWSTYITGKNFYLNTGAYAYYNGNVIAVVSSSSKRYKHNIKQLSADRDAHKLLELPIVEFEWNDDHTLQYADMKGKVIPGIIAEDVAKIYPSAVIHDQETGEIESWDERRIIPGMLALIQEQDKKIKDQEAEIEDLKSRLEKLEHAIMNITR